MIEVHLMDIIWHGHSCFELVSGGYSAVIDPFQDTSVGTAYPHVRLTADAVYISHEDRDHNFREGVTLRNTGKANPFAVTELETYHDIMRGRLRGMNTVRIFAAEGMRVAHLGDLGAKPTPEQMQQLQGLDAMMIPVGGIYTIEPDTAYYLCEQLQPRVIIPMHFQAPGHSNHRLRAPEDFTVTVREVKVSAGAGFIVALTGDIMTMPGLPKVPSAEKIDVDENGKITGLF